MKKYTILAIILIIFILLFIASMGIYFLKRDEIKANIFSKNTENTTVTEQGKECTDSEIKVIKTVGTGPKRPSNYTFEMEYVVFSSYLEGTENRLQNLVNSIENEQLKKEINEFISTSTAKLENEKKEFEKYIDDGNKTKGKVENPYDYSGDSAEVDYYNYGDFEGMQTEPRITTEYECVNGYLSICMYYEYNYGENIHSLAGTRYRNIGVYDAYCATYDLYTGKKLKFSDLFFEGEDYSTEIYELVENEIGKQSLGEYAKRDFTTIPEDYEYFTLNKIFFPKQNKYFSEGVIISHDHFVTTIPTITISRDMEGIFNSNVEIEQHENSTFDYRTTMIQEEILGVPFKVQKVKYLDAKIENKINDNVEKLLYYLVENDLFEKFISESGHSGIFAENRIGRGNTVNLYLNGCAIYYNAPYGILGFKIDPKTGEIYNLDFGMAVEMLKGKPEMVEELQNILNNI